MGVLPLRKLWDCSKAKMRASAGPTGYGVVDVLEVGVVEGNVGEDEAFDPSGPVAGVRRVVGVEVGNGGGEEGRNVVRIRVPDEGA